MRVTTAVAMAVLCLGTAWAQSALDELTQLKNFTAHRESSSDDNPMGNGDMRSLEPGEVLVLGDLQGPGIISHIWCTVGSVDMFHGRSLVLRVYYDGNENPSVQAPLGDFFGVGHGAYANYTSEPSSTSSYGRARNCFWKMPFRQSAKVTVTNESDKYPTDSFYYYLDWQKVDSLPEDTAYFHAKYRQEFPAQPGDYTILETQGRGHYVGTVYSVQQMETGWFGEGDDHFFIDGEETPSMRGTGTEDYFCDAWGFRALSTPYYGVSLWEGYWPGDRLTAYRWHIQDPIPFTKSLKMTIEHKGSVHTEAGESLGSFHERADWVSSVAFWYQAPAVGIEDALPPADQRIAPYRMFYTKDLTVRASKQDAVKPGKYDVSYLPMQDDAWIEFDFDVAEAGRYQVIGVIWYSLFSGVYQPVLDGKPVGGPLDLNTSGDDPVWVPLDLHDLQPGTHTLRFEGRGSSPNLRTPAPRTNAFAISYIALLRLEDLKGYHETMNRIQQERARKQ